MPVLKNLNDGIRAWLIGLFASAIKHTSRPEDRIVAIRWLSQSRDIVASDIRPVVKFRQLNALINSRTAIATIAKSVSETVTNYRKSTLPLSMKIALPATLAAIPLVGGHAAGIAAFWGAVGVPVVLLIFLGAVGITSIIESVVTSPDSHIHITEIIDIIIKDEQLRRTSAEIKAAMRSQPTDPKHFATPVEELARRQFLLSMDPYDFERHCMSFFQKTGLVAWTTPPSNDLGADGFAQHRDGLIVVQCKRNSTDNKVGGPVIQQFKGVIEEHGAYRGYVITTSAFTERAEASAAMTDKITLVAMDDLVLWHTAPPTFQLS